MAQKRSTSKPITSYIAPERLYTFEGLKVASGINGTRMHLARQRGVAPVVLQVGRRKFIRGSDAIAYIERLAELTRADAAAQKATGEVDG